jgi:hypothetical protein
MFKYKFFWVSLYFYMILHLRSILVYDGSYYVGISILLQLILMSIIVEFKTRKELMHGVDYLVKQLYLGLSITFLIVTFIPNNLYGDFSLGGHYNLGGPKSDIIMPFIVTTVDSPLLSSIIFIFSILIILNNKKLKGSWMRPKYKVFVIILLILSLLELLLINRRGPIFAALLTISTVVLFNKIRIVKLYYILPIFVIAPLFWEVIASWLYKILSSDLGSSLITKTDPENIETATGRVYTWNIVLDYMINFKWNIQYLFGVGQLPELEMLDDYGHAHNTIMELLIQVGLVGTTIIYTLIIRSIRHFFYLVKINNNFSYHLLFSIILYFMFLSIGESLLSSGYFSHLLFISILVIFNHIYYSNINKRPTIKNILIV